MNIDKKLGTLEPVHDLRRSRIRMARWMNCRLVFTSRLQFFHNLRYFSSHANERSTTQRFIAKGWIICRWTFP